MTTKPTNTQKPPTQQPWASRSHVAIFVRCLHYLDFDLLEDWPGVSEQLFTAKVAQQNLQQRVKAVEWSLYRLFETYDAVETKDKLRPFFPPTTQLQSLNLRAALYRALNELKKDGILGKDVVLRKTMLDDCKGERLEEALASFAMIVLNQTRKFPVTGNMHLPDSQLVPAILAYRSSLQNNLRVRMEESMRAQQTLDGLADAENTLLERLQRSTGDQMELDTEKHKQLGSLINGNWMGSQAWAETLLCGVPGQSIIEGDESADEAVTRDKPQQLIDELDDRIRRHQSRLAEWRVIAKEFATHESRTQTETGEDVIPAVKTATVSTRFSRHKDLNLTEWKAKPTTQPVVHEHYQRLSNAMRNELASLSPRNVSRSKDKQQANHSSPISMREKSPSPTSPAIPQLEIVQSPPNVSSSPLTLPVPKLVSGSELGMSLHIHEGNSLLDSPLFTNGSDPVSPWISNGDSNTIHTEEGLLPMHISSPELVIENQHPMTPSKIWMSLADRTRASISQTGRQSILPDADSSSMQGAEPIDHDATTSFHLSSDDDHHTTLLERTRKSMSMFASSSVPKNRKSKRMKQSTLPSPPEEELDALISSRAATPRDQLFSEDADYASVFKSRPKLASSPGLRPQRSISPLIHEHENGMDTLDAGLVRERDDGDWE